MLEDLAWKRTGFVVLSNLNPRKSQGSPAQNLRAIPDVRAMAEGYTPPIKSHGTEQQRSNTRRSLMNTTLKQLRSL
ncbi:MAG TPA: hypothetical protein VFX76_00765, partial [Roseiflexaceae bacterium]|nr:hypothetical protein [Roseiflexaceae bacterium]